MISRFTIQRIQNEARVEDVVGEFVKLKKRGVNYIGLCPFHNEKTPSFNVNPARNIYKCFGCGKAGGAVQFLMDYQQLSYPDALRYLAQKYNIEIEEEQVSDEEKQKELEKHNLLESIHIANSFAQKSYTEFMLDDDEGRIGLAYFKERGFLTTTIQKFQLGFAPAKGDWLTKRALANGFQLEVLKKAGLTSPKEGSTYDFFRNRVMFPIHNLTGKVIAFGGRIMVKDEKAPKYVNTPESEVYQKSNILYGIYFAKAAIGKKDECLLVEGYTDVLSLHQAGIENVVASSGTALTAGQIRLISRITANVTVLYDGDAAGIKAALKGTDLLLEHGLNVRVVILPSGEDPDSFVRSTGAESFVRYVTDKKQDLILFKTTLFAAEAKADPIRKAELIRDIVESIGKIPDPIQRSVYIKECAQLFDMHEQVLITEVNKRRRKQIREQEKSKAREVPATDPKPEDFLPESTHQALQGIETASSLPVLERDLLRVLLEFGAWEMTVEEETMTVAAYIMEELEGIEFQDKDVRHIVSLTAEKLAAGELPTAKFFTEHDEEAVRTLAITLLAEPYSISDNWWTKYRIVVPEKKQTFAQDVHSAVLRLKQYWNIVELKKVERLLKEVCDEEEVVKLLKLHKLLMEQKKDFAEIVGNVVYRPST